MMRQIVHVRCGTTLICRQEVTDDFAVGADDGLEVVIGDMIDKSIHNSYLYCPSCNEDVGDTVMKELQAGKIRLEFVEP